jgi:hypothetical protein
MLRKEGLASGGVGRGLYLQLAIDSSNEIALTRERLGDSDDSASVPVQWYLIDWNKIVDARTWLQPIY